MTHPISNDKIPTPHPQTNGRERSSGSGEQTDARSERSPTADAADVERASARYAQRLPENSSIGNAEQARGRVAQLRAMIEDAPQAALQAHGGIQQTGVDSALRYP